MNINGKIALVTGWTKWIWEAISLELAKEWAKVCVTYKSDEIAAKAFEKKIGETNKDFLIIKSDATKIEDTKNVFKEIQEKFWHVDILINNAWGLIEEELEAEELFKKSFDLNFFSAVYATEEFWQQNIQNWKIVNISSIAWINPFSYTWGTSYPEYGCAKAAIDLYTKISANKLKWKALVNWIAPWSTITPAWDEVEEDYLKLRESESLIWRYNSPQEMADTAIFVLKNDGINWEVIVVDWGNIVKGK